MFLFFFSVVPNNISPLVSTNCTIFTEQQYNIFRSLDEPYCSLCMMFNRKKVRKKSILLNYLRLKKVKG